jgi:hypothetical protein
MQQSVMEKLNEKSMKTIPYQQKIMLSAFLGQDLDNSLHQSNIAMNQTAGTQMPPPNQGSAQKVKPSQKGLGKLDTATSYMTPQQQSADRRNS